MTPPAARPEAAFGFIRYANVWEDPAILTESLRPAPGRRILSIASGGDNAFALLAGGAEVVAVDLSPAQISLVELKAAAIRTLDREKLLGFLGVTPHPDRLTVLDRLLPGLSPSAQAFWAVNRAQVGPGIIHAGKFERYFRIFRRFVLPLIHRRATVAAVLEARTPADRVAFYRDRWDIWRWRALFRVFFSRAVMGRFGRDPAFFAYVEGSVADPILARTRHALAELPAHDNPWLEYILTGTFARSLPPYLEEATLPGVREGLDRLTLRLAPIHEVDAGAFDGFNLSDVFEYLSPAQTEAVWRGLLARSRPGARFAWWEMMAPRPLPPAVQGLDKTVQSLDGLARDLHARDRAWFYQRFHLAERSR